MSYFVLLAAVLLFLTCVSLFDPSRRRMARALRLPADPAVSPLTANIELVAEEIARRFGPRHGELLRVPHAAMHGARRQDEPCLTPITCVQDKRCDGHCGCR